MHDPEGKRKAEEAMMRADTGVRRVQVGCWAVARRVAAAGVVTAAALVAAAPAASPRPTPPLQSTAVVVPQGLAWPGWRVEDPAEQPQELGRLLERERRAPASVPPLLAWRAAPPPPAARPARVVPFRPAAPVTAGPEAVAVALAFALDQVGKPYVWGAEGPDAYDCSGLTQRSYAEAGVLLPRTAAEQAQVGQPVALADLRPGDLVFWAYDPANPATVHHVALYAGDGLVVQAPQPGEFVEVTPLWLDGYAGAVRVATGPAGVPLPSVQVPGGGLPGSDIWSPTFGGSPDDTAGTTSAGPSTTTAPTSSGAPTTPDATPPSTARPSPSPTGTPSPDPTATPAPDPTSPPVATK
ncbi:MAG TPA: NlpC/P60 family protein, partial [Mycobacteriales bacterium]|nr:NlpC/P60 family protein [Mycobacteriales bacterium]